jgi:hypothetical protein
VLGNISFRMTLEANDLETRRMATATSMMSEVAALLAGILALAVVNAINARQTARAEALNESGRLARATRL